MPSHAEERLKHDLTMAVLYFFIWCWKLQWKIYRFTGIWAVILVLMLDVSLQPMGVPGDIWGVPFLLSVGFCIFWTTRSIMRRGKKATQEVHVAPTSPQHLPGGVFFGVHANKQAALKPTNEDGHILVIGGAGSGKSSCIAIPTLKSYWDGRFLAIDIKGELAEKSQRAAHIFNPSSPSALGYDPFYLVRESANPVPDIRDIALALAPLSPETRDPFWIQAAQNILTGHLLFGFKNGASFIETIDVLQSVPPRKLLETEVQDSQASRFLMQYADLKMETLSSIMAQIGNSVMVFATDPDVQTALTKPDILTPELLERGENIFLQLPEYKLEQWKQLMGLIVQQFLTHFERRTEGNQAPILFMLDEFARIGKIESILHGLATLRSKKITICILTQSLAQLDAIYSREQRQIIADNCSYKAILKATDAETQEYFSKLVGTEERVKETHTYDREGIIFAYAGEKGMSKTTEEKRIIKPEDFAYLQDIVLLSPSGFMRIQKAPYYLDTRPPLIHVAEERPPEQTVPPSSSQSGYRPREQAPVQQRQPDETQTSTSAFPSGQLVPVQKPRSDLKWGVPVPVQEPQSQRTPVPSGQPTTPPKLSSDPPVKPETKRPPEPAGSPQAMPTLEELLALEPEERLRVLQYWEKKKNTVEVRPEPDVVGTKPETSPPSQSAYMKWLESPSTPESQTGNGSRWQSRDPRSDLQTGGQPLSQTSQVVLQTATPPAPTLRNWQSQKSRTRGVRTFLVLLFFFVLVIGGLLSWANWKPATSSVPSTGETPIGITTTTPVATFPSTPNPYTSTGTLALSDPLADNTKGYKWNERSNAAGDGCLFSEGAYHAKQVTPNGLDWCAAQATDFENFTYEIQMRMIEGNMGGLFFRADTDKGSWYFLEITKNGVYSLERYDGFGQPAEILAVGTPSAAFRAGFNQDNTIAVVATGSDVSFYFNHQKMMSVSDATYSHGQIGLIASGSPADVAYSNAKVWVM